MAILYLAISNYMYIYIYIYKYKQWINLCSELCLYQTQPPALRKKWHITKNTRCSTTTVEEVEAQWLQNVILYT